MIVTHIKYLFRSNAHDTAIVHNLQVIWVWLCVCGVRARARDDGRMWDEGIIRRNNKKSQKRLVAGKVQVYSYFILGDDASRTHSTLNAIRMKNLKPERWMERNRKCCDRMCVYTIIKIMMRLEREGGRAHCHRTRTRTSHTLLLNESEK